MFTQNYISYRALMFCGSYSYMNKIPGATEFYDTTGTKIGHSSSTSLHAQYSYLGDLGSWLIQGKCGAIPTTGKSGGVYFGSGSTPANKTDYKLESPITSGLSITNQSQLATANDGNGKFEISASYIVTNTTEAEINIWEMGIVSWCSKANDNGSHPLLMERTVLDEPITIAPGEAKLVTYKITFNQTLNVE